MQKQGRPSRNKHKVYGAHSHKRATWALGKLQNFEPWLGQERCKRINQSTNRWEPWSRASLPASPGPGGPVSRQELIFSQTPKPYFWVLVWGSPTSKTNSLGMLPDSCVLGFPYLKAPFLLGSPSSPFVSPEEQQQIAASSHISSMEMPTVLECTTLDKHEKRWDVFNHSTLSG